MTTETQNQDEPVKMYRPWVGVLLSFFIAGTAQFLAGKRLNGIFWFLILFLLDIACAWSLVSPMVPSDFPTILLTALIFILWIMMLVNSCRPIPRFRRFGWVLFVVLILASHVVIEIGIRSSFRTFKIPTGSMAPTIRGNTSQPDGKSYGGDHVTVERYAYWFSKPQRGDIIVFRTSGIPENRRELYNISLNEYELKRIAGVPGDVLSIQEGHLYNHGQIVSEPVGLAKLGFPDLKMAQSFLTNSAIDCEVTNGTYFVIGDNTTNSLDSRYFGPIQADSIIGKVSKIYWPWNRVGAVQ